MTRTAAELDELAKLLGAASVRCRPYRYATSWSLEEVEVVAPDGTVSTVLLKDFDDARMLDDAQRSRPEFLRDPAREIEVYRRVLVPHGLGARVHASVTDRARSRWWLVCERVPGVELWQVGTHDVWEAVAAWIGAMHRSVARPATDQAELDHTAWLPRLDAPWFECWAGRARGALSRCRDARATELLRRLEGYGRHADALAAVPPSFVHGELYASNVLVVGAGRGVRVCPVDWEMAGLGPGPLDLAALLSGWEPVVAARLASAYGDVDDEQLHRCRLHLALQWIGWSPSWQPPAEQTRDWLGEALTLIRELA